MEKTGKGSVYFLHQREERHVHTTVSLLLGVTADGGSSRVRKQLLPHEALMEMLDQKTQQQISDLINACGGYWELRGIPQDRRNEMQLELEQHLEQAVRDGKSLETVVGPNALAFAESWARETPHQFSRGFNILFRWDWPFTLLLIGGAGGLFGLKFWLARDTRQEQQP